MQQSILFMISHLLAYKLRLQYQFWNVNNPISHLAELGSTPLHGTGIPSHRMVIPTYNIIFSISHGFPFPSYGILILLKIHPSGW